eukprot:m.25606 g.25606  ORF g.25606 m.25606 type:complete len:439 (+) comp6217_c0_seq1:144-1460(+)
MPPSKPSVHRLIAARTVLGVLLLYGLGQSCARDVLMTKQPDIERTLHLSPSDVARILSAGYISYALGKLVYGRVTDVWGGQAVWVFSFTGAAFATAAFAICRPGNVGLLVCWVVSRAFQPAAGMGSVRIAAAWFSYTDLGRILSWIAAMSYLWDAGVRFWISGMTLGGLSWQNISLVLAATTLMVAALGLLFLRDNPLSVGQAGPSVSPHAIDPGKTTVSLWQGLSILFRSWNFILVLLLGVTLGATREIFLCFLESLLHDAGASKSVSIAFSGAFPLFGVPSVLLCGRLVDAYDRRRNGAIVFVNAACLLGLSGALWALESGWLGHPRWWAVAALSAAIGMAVIGPYSLLGGVFAADLGGRAACGLASGLVDCAAYLGAIAFTSCKSQLTRDVDVALVVFALAVANLLVSGAMLLQDRPAAIATRGEAAPLLINADD